MKSTAFQIYLDHCRVLAAVLALSSYLLVPSPAAHAQDAPIPLSSMSDADREVLESTLTSEANRTANSTAFFDPDMRPISVGTSLDTNAKVLRIDMEERFGEHAGYTEMSDLAVSVEETIERNLQGFEKLERIDWRYGGKSIDHWMPIPESESSDAAPHAAKATTRKPVLVAAGHGAYYHHGYRRWTTHRGPSFGIIEDHLTPTLAAELVRFLKLNLFDAEEVRSASVFTTHPSSGLPFWQLGARYHLEALLPNVATIWHSLPDSKADTREKSEDHKSRPLYANHVGAAAIFNIHTNAVDAGQAGTTRGARAYVYPGRPQDARLARMALCGMNELIHSSDRFRDFNVATGPHTSTDHAETRLAKMPSVIIETAFHTHPADAELLQDPEFQKLAMMGVAKGYKLFTEGLNCVPFKMASEAPVEAFVGQQVKLSVNVSGNPYYPLDVRYKPSRCLKQPCRSIGKLLFSEDEVKAYRINYVCGRGDVADGPIDYEVHAEDAYGVSTNRITRRLTCKARGG